MDELALFPFDDALAFPGVMCGECLRQELKFQSVSSAVESLRERYQDAG